MREGLGCYGFYGGGGFYVSAFTPLSFSLCLLCIYPLLFGMMYGGTAALRVSMEKGAGAMELEGEPGLEIRGAGFARLSHLDI